MVLALDNDLLEAVDELVAAFGRKVFFAQELLRAVDVVTGLILVFLWNLVRDLVLKMMSVKLRAYMQSIWNNIPSFRAAFP